MNADLVHSSSIELTNTANIFTARIYIANEILSTSNEVNPHLLQELRHEDVI